MFNPMFNINTCMIKFLFTLMFNSVFKNIEFLVQLIYMFLMLINI